MATTYDVEAVLKVTGSSEFSQAFKDAEKAVEGFKKVGSKVTDIGKSLTKHVTLPIAAAGVASVKAFADFETAMKGVSKTTDLTAKEFEQMGDDIMKMTRTMPVAAVEIGNVAEAAGQLGIEKENILDFAETMIKLGTSTNMGSDEAATALARLANITQMPQTEFERLGSTVVALGNNLATTEKEIVDMGLRLAGTGSVIGLTEAQILGLAGAMSSVGIKAEGGGTAFSKVMQDINSAVLSGSDHISEYAKVAGMSADQFAKAWKDDPQEALIALVDGLSKVNKAGGDVAGTIKELGFTNSRQIDTLQRLAGAEGSLAEALDISNVSWRENVALTEEADEAWSSFSNQIQILKNALFEAGNEIGKVLAPVIGQIAEAVTKATQAFSDLPDEVQGLIIKIALIAAVIGPVVLVIGKMITFFANLKVALAILKPAFAIFAGGAGLIVAKVLLIVAAIAGLIAFFKHLYEENEAFREGVDRVWTAIKDAIGGAITAISDFIKEIWGGVVDWWNENNELIKEAATVVWDEISRHIQYVMDIITEIFSGAWDIIKTIFNTVLTTITTILEVAMDYAKGFIKAAMQLIIGDWQGAWETVKETVFGVWDKIITYIDIVLGAIVSVVSTALSTVANVFRSIFENIWDSVITNLTKIRNLVPESMQGILDSIIGFLGRFREAGSNIIGSIADGITGAAGKVTGAISRVVQKVRDFLPFSPAKEGPLRDLDKLNFGGTISDSIMKDTTAIQKALNFALEIPDMDGVEVSQYHNAETSVEYELGGHAEPAYITLSIGGRSFRAFVSDITKEQDSNTELELIY